MTNEDMAKDMVRIRREIVSLGSFETKIHCLKDIKIQRKCISIAIYHLEQIAALGDDILAALANGSIACLKQAQSLAFENYLDHLISQIKKKW